MTGSVYGLLVMAILSWRHKRQARQQDREVEQLYRTYGHILQRRCRRILRDAALVEDAMQEIKLSIWQHHGQYRGEPRKILSWLYRITTTHCLQLIKKDKRWLRTLAAQLAVLEQEPARSQHHEDVDAQLTMASYLDSLPAQEREVVCYRFISGMTQEEIAEVMQVSRDQVRRWLKHFQKRGQIVLREVGGSQ